MTRTLVAGMLLAAELGAFTPAAHADFAPCTVVQMDGDDAARELPAASQIVTQAWDRVVAVPYIVYMPERDRLALLVGCDYPHQPMTLLSDDRGATWSDPRPLSPDPAVNAGAGLGVSLTYLGEGRVILSAGGRWFSEDFGETWEGPVPIPPASNGQPWYQWDPLLVDRDAATGAITRLIETGYNWEGGGPDSPTGYEQGFIRFSEDLGRTWSEDIRVREWHGVSEVDLLRAADGRLIGACRTDMARQYVGNIDHYEGLGVSISEDDGHTWSPVNRLYDFGRHHPCMVLMPDGAIVMTYVVRLGYPADEAGMPQFGIEAVVSRDNGDSFDLKHRYVLARWSGNRTGPNAWWASSQATSTVLLPDGSLLTTYGTGYRSEPLENGLPGPRDVGLIRWRLE
jgi:hypothetical protein